MLLIHLPRILKNELGRYIIRTFKYTYNQEKRAFKKDSTYGIDLDYDATHILRQLHEGIPRSEKFYETFTGQLGDELDKVLAEAFIEDKNLDAMIDRVLVRLDRKLNLSIVRATRIARTELINVSNEARLSAYQEREKEEDEPYKYTLVVAQGARTCNAHRELKNKIPKGGLLLSDLVELQIKIGHKHYGSKWNLQGHALMHPNQRTTLVRAI
tara:strand:+ start:432 stop:1070 length:639 start_codon:yes stop_codon:yes gene_type:complete